MLIVSEIQVVGVVGVVTGFSSSSGAWVDWVQLKRFYVPVWWS